MKNKDLSDKEMLDMYEYKRSYPRVEINSPVSLFLSESRQAEAIAHDLSFEGLRILCDHKTARVIEGENNTDIEVRFTLTMDDKQELIDARCAIMYMLKLIDETLAMGVRITDIEEDKQNYLKHFIESSLEPM